MATSVIDYVFRDLAISYLKRSDLGQVKPEDLVATATKSEADAMDSKPREKQSSGFRPPAQLQSQPMPAPSGKFISKGQSGSQGGTVKACALAPQTQVMVMDQPYMDESYPEESEVIKIVQARIKGYEGDPCSSCGSFTLLRNGTCMKCDTCGSTTGCS